MVYDKSQMTHDGFDSGEKNTHRLVDENRGQISFVPIFSDNDIGSLLFAERSCLYPSAQTPALGRYPPFEYRHTEIPVLYRQVWAICEPILTPFPVRVGRAAAQSIATSWKSTGSQSNDEVFDKLVERLYNEITVYDLNIIEDYSDIKASVREDILEMGEDTITFLNNYVDQLVYHGEILYLLN